MPGRPKLLTRLNEPRDGNIEQGIAGVEARSACYSFGGSDDPMIFRGLIVFPELEKFG